VLELTVRRPACERKLLEAARQLHVAADRLSGVVDAETDQGNLQFVADIAQRIENDALLSKCAGEYIVNLVEQQNLNVHGAHEANSDLFEFNHRRPRVLRNAHCRQDLGIQAPLAWLASELQGKNTRALNTGLAVEERRVLGAKALHDHRLAHAAVAVDRDARHPGGARMLQQKVENAQRVGGAGILHPAFAEDGANALIMRHLQQLGGARGQMRQIIAHAFRPPPSSPPHGLRESIPFRPSRLLSGGACGGRSSRLLRVATVCRRAASTISRWRRAVLNRRGSLTSWRPWARSKRMVERCSASVIGGQLRSR